MKNESFSLEKRVEDLENQVDALSRVLDNHLMYTTPCGPILRPEVNYNPKPMTEEEMKDFIDRWNRCNLFKPKKTDETV